MTDLKGQYKGNCNRTACQKPNAVWFNHSTRKYYCAECAGTINMYDRGDAMRMFGHDLCTYGEHSNSILQRHVDKEHEDICPEFDSELDLFLKTLIDGSSEYFHRHEELRDCTINIPQPLKQGQKRPSKYARRAEMRTEPKIGRNEPCSCGSGLKYKKCCLNKKEE